jgi:hypothetical protein
MSTCKLRGLQAYTRNFGESKRAALLQKYRKRGIDLSLTFVETRFTSTKLIRERHVCPPLRLSLSCHENCRIMLEGSRAVSQAVSHLLLTAEYQVRNKVILVGSVLAKWNWDRFSSKSFVFSL